MFVTLFHIALLLICSCKILCAAHVDKSFTTREVHIPDSSVTTICLSSNLQHLAYVSANTDEVVVMNYPSCTIARRVQFTTLHSDMDTSGLPKLRAMTQMDPHKIFVLAVKPSPTQGSFTVLILVSLLKFNEEMSDSNRNILGWSHHIREFILEPGTFEPHPRATLSTSTLNELMLPSTLFSDCGLYIVKTISMDACFVGFRLLDSKTHELLDSHSVRITSDFPNRKQLEYVSMLSSSIENNYCLLWDRWNYLPLVGSFKSTTSVSLQPIQGSRLVRALKQKLESYAALDEMESATQGYVRHGNPALIDLALSDGHVVLAGMDSTDVGDKLVVERYNIRTKMIVGRKQLAFDRGIKKVAVLHSGKKQSFFAIKHSAHAWSVASVRL